MVTVVKVTVIYCTYCSLKSIIGHFKEILNTKHTEETIYVSSDKRAKVIKRLDKKIV